MREQTEDFARAVHDGSSKKNLPRSSKRTRMNGGDNWISIAFHRALKAAEIESQNGPVKILWKDGKPVGR